MFRKVLCLCLLLLVVALPSQAQETATTAEDCIQRGKFLYNLGLWEQAIANFDQAIELDQTNPEAYYIRANIFHDMGQMERAISDYDHTLELNTEFAPAWSDRGSAYLRLGEADHAIADFNEALALDADYLNACTGRGMAYVAQGDYEAAVADFDHALEVDPANGLAWFHRGYANFEWGHYREAVDDFTHSIALDPNCLNQCELDYFNRGNGYVQLGDFQSAIADYTRSIKANPNFSGAYQNRGLVYADQGQTELALADLNEYVRLNEGQASSTIRMTIAELERANVVVQPDDLTLFNVVIGVFTLLVGADLLIHFRPDPATSTTSPEILAVTRTRGPVLTILLVLGILSGLSTALNFWFGSSWDRMRHMLPWLNDAEWFPVALGLVGLLLTISALAMWNWRKWGFYLLIAASVLNGLLLIAAGLPLVWALSVIFVIDLIWGRLRKRWIYFT